MTNHSKYILLTYPESKKYILEYELYEENGDTDDVILGPRLSVLVSEELLKKDGSI